MELSDFCEYFDGVDILDRHVDINDVVMTIDESLGCSAPLIGCIKGCFGYWCLCQGPAHVLCPHISSKSTAKVPFYKKVVQCRCYEEDTFEV